MQSTPQRTVGGLCKYFFFITTFWTDLWNNMFLKWKAFIKKKNNYYKYWYSTQNLF